MHDIPNTQTYKKCRKQKLPVIGVSHVKHKRTDVHAETIIIEPLRPLLNLFQTYNFNILISIRKLYPYIRLILFIT